jgi:putative membrane protein
MMRPPRDPMPSPTGRLGVRTCKDQRVLGILANIVVNAAAVWVATLIIPGVSIEGGTTSKSLLSLAIVGALLGIVNAFIKPLIKALTSCLYVVTFGLMAFVVNALMLRIAGWLAGKLGVHFDAGPFFWSTVGAAVVVTLVSMVLNRALVAADQD